MEFAELTPEEKLMSAIFGWRLEAEHFLSDVRRKAVRDLLDELNEQREWQRGVKVLRLRFGFEPRTDLEKTQRPGSDARSLKETGVYFNVTPERIRQIEQKTLRNLRHPSQSRKLKDYLD